MKKRSRLSLAVAAFVAVAVSLTTLGCGKNFYFAGRNLPPSGVTQRVLVAVQNPVGSLQFMDAYYDIRHPFNSATGTFSIASYSGNNPVTIQNLPEEQTGLVYSSGDGSLASINYGMEKLNSNVVAGGSIATSIFGSHKLDYFVAADQNAHALVVSDVALGTFLLNVPGINRVSINTNASLALGFVQDSNEVFTAFKLTTDQQTKYATQAQWLADGLQDCEPQTLPKYCVGKVADPSQLFDRPTKAIFSADGQTIYVLNCGPECGGRQSGIVSVGISSSVLNKVVGGPSGLPQTLTLTGLTASSVLAVPGGATNALQNASTLYVAGQQPVQAQGQQLLAGYLSVVNLASNTVTSYPISDGTHNKMIFADDNTLWIGSQRCQNGYRFAQNQAGVIDSATGQTIQFGCLTRFDTGSNAVTVDRYIGDLTGIADVEGLHKIYVGEGGQVHIYKTADFTELDNSNVTVTGTVSDVAYMDGTSDANNTTY